MELPVSQLSVWVGAHSLAARDQVPMSVEKKIMHPEYRCRYFHNDVALLRLAQEVRWMPDATWPACLPAATNEPNYSRFNGRDAIAAGWGWTKEGDGARADVLQKVTSKHCSNFHQDKE